MISPELTAFQDKKLTTKACFGHVYVQAFRAQLNEPANQSLRVLRRSKYGAYYGAKAHGANDACYGRVA